MIGDCLKCLFFSVFSAKKKGIFNQQNCSLSHSLPPGNAEVALACWSGCREWSSDREQGRSTTSAMTRTAVETKKRQHPVCLMAPFDPLNFDFWGKQVSSCQMIHSHFQPYVVLSKISTTHPKEKHVIVQDMPIAVCQILGISTH